MRSQGMMTGKKATKYTTPLLEDLEEMMTPEELAQAQVRGFSIQVIEPGAQQANTFLLPEEMPPPDFDSLLFQAVEVECRTAQARGWVKRGQTSGSVDAPVTFRATSVRKVDMQVVFDEMKRREQADTDASDRRKEQRQAFEDLRKQVEARQKQAAQVTNGTASVKPTK